MAYSRYSRNQRISNRADSAISRGRVPLSLCNDIALRTHAPYFYANLYHDHIDQRTFPYFIETYCKALSFARVDPESRIRDDFGNRVSYERFDPLLDMHKIQEHGYISHEFHHHDTDYKRIYYYDLNLLDKVFDEKSKIHQAFCDHINRFTLSKGRKDALKKVKSIKPEQLPTFRSRAELSYIEEFYEKYGLKAPAYLLASTWTGSSRYGFKLDRTLDLYEGHFSGSWLICKDGSKKQISSRGATDAGYLDTSITIELNTKIGNKRNITGFLNICKGIFSSGTYICKIDELDIKNIQINRTNLPLPAFALKEAS